MNSTTTASTIPAPVGTKPRGLMQRIDPRWYSSSLLTVLLVIGHWKYNILGDSYVPWLMALGTSVVAELVLFRWLRGGWPNLLSAYISGNSVAFLLKPQGSELWPFVMASLLSITSKYVLNYEKRHLWNPTNFGICALLLLTPRSALLGHEWGNDWAILAVIWPIGLITVWRARVLHITLAYLGAFLLFACVRATITGNPLPGELAPITGPMYQLFIFFMVTDPRTIVRGKRQQLFVVLVVAAMECVIRLSCDFEILTGSNPLRVAPALFALFLVGPPFLAWQLWRTKAPADRT